MTVGHAPGHARRAWKAMKAMKSTMKAMKAMKSTMKGMKAMKTMKTQAIIEEEIQMYNEVKVYERKCWDKKQDARIAYEQYGKFAAEAETEYQKASKNVVTVWGTLSVGARKQYSKLHPNRRQ